MNTDTVIVRRWKNGSIIALFPYQPGTNLGEVNSYEHVGQHGDAHYSHVISETQTAYLYENTTGDPSVDVSALLGELRRIGYQPVVRQRRVRRMQAAL